MLLSDYQASLLQVIQYFIDAGWATRFEFGVDVQPKIEKLAYSFHYQSSDENLVFRYDNAAHKPVLGYEHHKHIGQDIIPANIPTLEAVLWEVVYDFLVAS